MKNFSLAVFILFLLCLSAKNLYSLQEASPYSSSFSQAKFVPDISFILDCSAVYRDIDNEEFEGLEMPGFMHHHEDDAGHGHHHEKMHANSGFNFNYGELALYSAVDPYFELFGTFHLGIESFEVEEGFVNTTSLPLGLQLKIGKFLSGIGRLNGQHAHYWDFADQPVVYESILGDHGLLEIGAQLGWIAPIDTYLLIGAEALKGENEKSFGYEGFSNNAIEVKSSKFTGCYTAFIKSSFDINSLTVLYGASGAFGRARMDHGLTEESDNALYGDTLIAIGDLTIKYFIDPYRYVSLQGEYLHRNIEGDYYKAESAGTTIQDIEKNHSGFYSQLVVKPFLLWRMGVRYEMLDKNKIEFDGEEADLPDKFNKYSAMVEYNPSEFSRIRLQYNYNNMKYEGDEDFKEKPFHEVILQVNMTIGAHGAHNF